MDHSHLLHSQPEELLLKTLSHCNSYHGGFYFFPRNLYLVIIKKEVGFIQVQLKVMIKTSKNITGWFIPSHILPLRPNHHVPTVLLWHANMLFFRIICLMFNYLPVYLHICQPIFPNKVIQVVLCLNRIICLSYVWYNLYHLLPRNPMVWPLSCNNYIFNIIFLPLR